MPDPKDPKPFDAPPSPFQPSDPVTEDADAERVEEEGEPFDGNFA